MEKVDSLINAMCEHIENLIKGDETRFRDGAAMYGVAVKTRALAELVTARALVVNR